MAIPTIVPITLPFVSHFVTVDVGLADKRYFSSIEIWNMVDILCDRLHSSIFWQTIRIANDNERCAALNQSRGWKRAMPAASHGVFVCPSEPKTEDAAQGVRDDIADDIVDKKGLKSSVVWSYFGFLKSKTKQSIVHCKLCRAINLLITSNLT